jgi:nicotinate phosphoribosyltransferase
MIIESMLDDDLYKLTMMQLFFHRYPNAKAKYKFDTRGVSVRLGRVRERIDEAITDLCTLRYTDEELKYLESLGYFKSDFLNFLSTYQLKRDLLHIMPGAASTESLEIFTDEANILDTMGFEVRVLAIVSEIVNFSSGTGDWIEKQGRIKLRNKLKIIADQAPDAQIIEFGTRRRYSRLWQEYVVKYMIQKARRNLLGTSNMHLARTLGLTIYGTMAHEYFQAFQSFVPHLRDFQRKALEVWLEEYGDKLKIALTDTIGLNSFWTDFDKGLATTYSGVRLDSGSMVDGCRLCIANYKQMGIDPKTKTIICSDGLNEGSILDLYSQFNHQVNLVFGVGTNLTNDVRFGNVPSFVMKMVQCNGKPVAKISNSAGKGAMFDQNHIKDLQMVFGVVKKEDGESNEDADWVELDSPLTIPVAIR